MAERDIDNCVIERILRNKFHDPLLSSDDSDTDETQRVKINWDEVFKKKDNVSMLTNCVSAPNELFFY